MNDWATAGCRKNIETIYEWLMEEAQERGLSHGRVDENILQTSSLEQLAQQASNRSSPGSTDFGLVPIYRGRLGRRRPDASPFSHLSFSASVKKTWC
ncbi:MAG: hypothetical protein ACPGLY_27335 [Rubripirellula sp.]